MSGDPLRRQSQRCRTLPAPKLSGLFQALQASPWVADRHYHQPLIMSVQSFKKTRRVDSSIPMGRGEPQPAAPACLAIR